MKSLSSNTLAENNEDSEVLCRDIGGNDFNKAKKTLQIFQSTRINSTYEDMKKDPQFQMIGDFFFNKLYAPEDFTFRDTSIQKLHKVLDGKIYKGMLTAITKVIELHELSDDLDNLMVKKMLSQGLCSDITMDQYQDIYRSLSKDDQRIYQINLSAEVTRIFHALSKKWIVAISLKTVKAAAILFGIKEIIDFIYDGYVSFKAIDNIDLFIDTMLERELAWHNEICSGTSDK
ncbi:MAG: hypothetical protein GY729_11870 [Desulfobacteraceae bacterium]|nr:hypothetical protein [Desulfobacteraceae bacterium]